MPLIDIVAIVNPLSGRGADPTGVARRVALLESRFSSAGVKHRIHLTERPRHAHDLAMIAAAEGATIVIAWGGDGTINEIGTALAGTASALGIVPAGSGNGFAAELGLPRAPEAALDVVIHGRDKAIDVGEINGRLFFNIAGIGFDAMIAARFNRLAMGRRGMAPYVRIGLGEVWRYRGARYRVTLDTETIESDALLIAFANGRDYGNGLRLAANARLDDGRLEALVVADRSPLARLWSGRHLAFGSADTAPGVICRSIATATVESVGDMPFHVDGELGIAAGRAEIRLHPGHLRVRVSADR